MASSAGVFGAVADMLVALYNAAGFRPISKWVDDFLVVRLPGQSWTKEEFIGLTANLGVPWNEAKLRKFAKMQRYIGFDWWVDEKAMEPVSRAKKLQCYMEICFLVSTTSSPALSSSTSLLELRPSPLQPNCPAKQRLFLWTGINTPPPSIINDPVLLFLANAASQALLANAASYGAGLCKYHICDIFSIPESACLPAPFHVLHSFALWAASDPESLDPDLASLRHFELVGVSTVRKYLSAIRAWHIAQGWPEPLNPLENNRIDWSLRGLGRIVPARKRPLRPPITIHMLRTIRAALILSDPFDACIWAMATCAFRGLMRFGEVSSPTSHKFNGALHLKRSNAALSTDLNGARYARLDLPSAKTAKPGETQSVFIAEQEPDLCALRALANLAAVVPAAKEDPLFSWQDKHAKIRPMAKQAALKRINGIFSSVGLGTTFGHSFRIGAASFFLARKVDPEIVHLAGRWKSLAYETYIRSFELVVNQHTGNLATSDLH
ncbi:hypothetical protein AGABI1DRAFT_95523 [Agaricus bisporus var. burnettii JB137-S8]|uniref:Uncharacterized protein n=1 Tax=Agaricus bisporus var. burnettii (strain JB137-S8 / ATCC MYA-4627 / FGSC 10392) TaxID=597362 RepID=K5WV17_AGABU|nr:uncharacterized protein AGABI1DRAFT_95523 [Agaricus bisporus var. burnettii JB137-S8]EKM74593.1 hypothetical protein AGABI1DRAFT_95523 [Agaricus bisporus var. burnettii JB137-S8]